MINEHVVRRWIRIVCFSMWGPLTLFAISLTPDRFGRFVVFISKEPLWFTFVCLTLISAFIFVPFLRTTPLTWAQFRFFHRYPPAWVGSVLGVLWIWILHLILDIGPPYLAVTLKWGSIFIVTALALALPYARFVTEFRQSNGAAPNLQIKLPFSRFSDITGNWQSFSEWVGNDNPITRSEQDLFEMRVIARRMVKLFWEQESAGSGFSAGLVGPLGSGKTSIINLMKRDLADASAAQKPHVWVCEISCWGFDNSAAALKYVLSEIVKTIGEYVDCSGLRGMPDAYSQALSAGNGGMRILGGLFASERDPGKQLSRLIPILRAVNARLLIVLEDVDRNQSSSFNCDDITAMLFRLKEVKEVSFILAASSKSRVRIDFSKICDHIEVMPRPGQKAILNAFEVVRKHCIEDYHFIDPAKQSSRRNTAIELWTVQSEIWPTQHPGLPAAVSSLVSSPRNLKHVFRNVVSFWRELNGEIDLDELMVVSILRRCAPEGFDFLCENIGLLRQAPEDGKDPTERQKGLQTEWERLADKVEWDQRSAMDLILFLIPNAKEFLKGRSPWNDGDLPQSIAKSSPTDYWPRMVRGSLSEGEISDQEILREVEQWRESGAQSPKLARYLYEHENSVRIWEHLNEFYETPNLLQLAECLFEIVLQEEGARASAGNLAGLGIWRRASRFFGKTASNAEWLAKNIKRAVPISLEMGVTLYYYWASPQYGIVDSLARDASRDALVSEFKTLVQSRGPEALIAILDEMYPFSLSHLVFPPDHHPEKPSILLEPTDWQWLAAILLPAARIAPHKIVPQLACLVTHSRRTAAGEPMLVAHSLDMNKATGIFGPDLRELMECLAQEVTVEDKSTAEVVESVRSNACSWLNSNQALST